MKKLFAVAVFLLALMSPTLALSCNDSDGGLSYFEAGSTIDSSGMGTFDYCDFTINNPYGVIFEAVCENGSSTHYNATCPEGTPYCNRAVCSEKKPVCTDTDGGLVYEVKGTITEPRISEGPQYTDYCENLNTKQPWNNCEGNLCGVREFYCTEPYFSTNYKDMSCPEGCSDGVCLGNEEPLACKDTDGGKNYEKKGQVCVTGDCKYDACTDGTHLTEYYCQTDDGRGSDWHECSYGCSDGACVKETPNASICTDTDSGKEYYVKGTTVGTNSQGEPITEEDTCGFVVDEETGELNYNYLNEFYCVGSVVYGIQPDCPNGCLDGACLKGEPIPSMNLVKNGDFSQGFDFWEQYHASNVNDTYKLDIVSEGANSFYFKREDSRNDGGKTWITQKIKMSTDGYENLRLLANVKVLSSNLYDDWWPTGEGNYPVHIYIKYLDKEGKEHTWSHGFVDHKMINTNGRMNYEVVPANEWVSYVSINLLSLDPKPVILTEVIVGGDGWDYSGQIDSISIQSSMALDELHKGYDVINEKLVEVGGQVSSNYSSDFEGVKEKVVQTEVLVEEYEQKEEQRGFTYQLKWFFGMAENEEKDDAAFLKNQYYTLVSSVEILKEIAANTEEPAKSILIEQANELSGKAEGLMQESENKEKNAKGVLSWFGL